MFFLQIDLECNDFALFLLHFGSEYNVFSLISLYFASKYNDPVLIKTYSWFLLKHNLEAEAERAWGNMKR